MRTVILQRPFQSGMMRNCDLIQFIGILFMLTLGFGCEGAFESMGGRTIHQELAFPSSPSEVSQGVFVIDGVERKLVYTVVNDHIVVDGDMILGRTGTDGLQTIEQSLSAVEHDKLWPNKTVPFRISNVGTEKRDRIRSAIRYWRRNTDMKFVPRTDQEDYVLFQHGDGCSAYVGRIGGPQGVFLSDQCSRGNIIHEIGHAIGLHHTQSRADRDSFVTLHPENMKDDVAHNFAIFSDRIVGPYDYDSIMHYGSTFFSRNGEPTMTKPDGSLITARRDKLSPADLRSISMLYGEPIGTIEVVARQPSGRVRLKGFAIDPDVLVAIVVTIKVDGVVVSQKKAKLHRPDLRKLYRRGARHGFDRLVTAPVGSEVCVEARNVENGVDVVVGCKIIED